jgi:hypothetical protein
MPGLGLNGMVGQNFSSYYNHIPVSLGHDNVRDESEMKGVIRILKLIYYCVRITKEKTL